MTIHEKEEMYYKSNSARMIGYYSAHTKLTTAFLETLLESNSINKMHREVIQEEVERLQKCYNKMEQVWKHRYNKLDSDFEIDHEE